MSNTSSTCTSFVLYYALGMPWIKRREEKKRETADWSWFAGGWLIMQTKARFPHHNLMLLSVKWRYLMLCGRSSVIWLQRRNKALISVPPLLSLLSNHSSSNPVSNLAFLKLSPLSFSPTNHIFPPLFRFSFAPSPPLPSPPLPLFLSPSPLSPSLFSFSFLGEGRHSYELEKWFGWMIDTACPEYCKSFKNIKPDQMQNLDTLLDMLFYSIVMKYQWNFNENRKGEEWEEGVGRRMKGLFMWQLKPREHQELEVSSELSWNHIHGVVWSTNKQ